MSGIAALFNRDGPPADRALLQRMIDAVPYRGPDGANIWTDGPVGLGHAMMCTTPESLHETQPLYDKDAGLVLTMDGRVDNRVDLAAQIKAKGYRLRDHSDAELVLRAYECWSEESAEKIIGDFAYVIWDMCRRRLFCVRDPLGVRPFYYCISDRTFRAASELQQIVSDPRIAVEPNESMVAQYLAVQISSRTQTLVKGVSRLAPGHFLIVNAQGIRETQYFDVCASKRVSYRTDEEYAASFRELLMESVRARLRSTAPVAAHLSGGLDSSSVIGAAMSLIQQGAVSDPGLESISLEFSDPRADEREYYTEAVNTWSLRSACIRSSPITESDCVDEIKHYRDLPTYPNGFMLDSIGRVLGDRGIRVCLSGQGGDDWLTGSSMQCADLLRKLHFLRLTSLAATEARCGEPVGTVPGFAGTARTIVALGAWPLFCRVAPKSLKETINRIRGRRSFPQWLDPEFLRRAGFFESHMPECKCGWHAGLADSDSHSDFLSPFLAHTLEMSERLSSSLQIEDRHPFLDKRLVEYCFGLPEDQRRRDAVIKVVLRNAMRGLIPEKIRQRRSKADLSATFGNALVSFKRAAFRLSSKLHAAGWIEAGKFREQYERTIGMFEANDSRFISNQWQLWAAVAVGLWAESL